jgi:aspartyl protease family protein
VRWIVVDRMVVAGSVLQNVEAAVPEKDVGLSLLGQNALAQFTKLEINGDDLLLMR